MPPSGVATSYSQAELDELVAGVAPRSGWDFSRMSVRRAPAPWEYTDVVSAQLASGDHVLDVGTGGGERFVELLAGRGVGFGLGVDIDAAMIDVARENGRGLEHLSFRQSSHLLEHVSESFDVVVNRHAPFSLDAIVHRLRPGGRFITQQVGERNMLNVKVALGQELPAAPVARDLFADAGFAAVEIREYDVEYVVRDAASLVFWLGALDLLHADVAGAAALADVDVFNGILSGNVTDAGFVTNEHRYLVIATR
ncbi:class I SAM-dependent methyltransferase [Plantibacter sp. Mn2098]|uniref:class I SAM-dependent methyltransferase n=1 Tax=Plantibacter sp. Mn2098 TaxID=3395266 RepID=UPI003BD316A7